MTAWLTQIIPDYRNEQVRKDLRDVVAMHKRVMMLIPDGLGDQARRQAGVLYRIDESARGTRILIQTRIPPDLAGCPPDTDRREPANSARCSPGWLPAPSSATGSPPTPASARATAPRSSRSAGPQRTNGGSAGRTAAGSRCNRWSLIHLTTPSAARTGKAASAMPSRASTGWPRSPIPAPCAKRSWPVSAAADPTAAGCSASRRSARAARPHEQRQQHLACGNRAAPPRRPHAGDASQGR